MDEPQLAAGGFLADKGSAERPVWDAAASHVPVVCFSMQTCAALHAARF